MDLSKAYGCLPYDLIIAKFEAYGFDNISLKLFHSYFSNQKQRVKIGSARGETFYSLFVTLYSLLLTLYSLLVTFYSLLVTLYSLLVTFYSLLVTFYSVLFGTYLLLVATYWVLITFYSYSIALYSQCSHYIMRQFRKRKIQALLDAFLRSVDIV